MPTKMAPSDSGAATEPLLGTEGGDLADLERGLRHQDLTFQRLLELRPKRLIKVLEKHGVKKLGAFAVPVRRCQRLSLATTNVAGEQSRHSRALLCRL